MLCNSVHSHWEHIIQGGGSQLCFITGTHNIYSTRKNNMHLFQGQKRDCFIAYLSTQIYGYLFSLMLEQFTYGFILISLRVNLVIFINLSQVQSNDTLLNKVLLWMDICMSSVVCRSWYQIKQDTYIMRHEALEDHQLCSKTFHFFTQLSLHNFWRLNTL